jgi:hypothetical protein
MEQVYQEKKNVTVETVKLAWEQAKENVGEEERAEEGIPLVATEENADGIKEIGLALFLFWILGSNILNILYSAVEMCGYVLDQSSDSSTIIRTLLIIRLIVMVINAPVSLLALAYVFLYGNLCSRSNELIPGTRLLSISLLFLASLSYASSLIIASILHSYGYESSHYAESIIHPVMGLAPYGLTLMITIYSYSKQLARSTAKVEGTLSQLPVS